MNKEMFKKSYTIGSCASEKPAQRCAFNRCKQRLSGGRTPSYVIINTWIARVLRPPSAVSMVRSAQVPVARKHTCNSSADDDQAMQLRIFTDECYNSHLLHVLCYTNSNSALFVCGMISPGSFWLHPVIIFWTITYFKLYSNSLRKVVFYHVALVQKLRPQLPSSVFSLMRMNKSPCSLSYQDTDACSCQMTCWTLTCRCKALLFLNCGSSQV